MSKLKVRWVLWLIVMSFCILCCWNSYREGYQAGYRNGQLDTLPTQAEVQAILGVEVDGVIGRESRAAWNALIERRVCDEYARPIMEEFMAEFDKTLDIGD